MKATLHGYQEVASNHLYEILSTKRAALDASDTGIGKTFTALGTAQKLGLKPLIICPKAVQTSWRHAAEALGVELMDVVNIEKLKTGNTPHLDRKKLGGKNIKFAWKLAPGSLIIWDECQNASGYKSQNTTVLALTRAYSLKALCLSATVADNPLKMQALGFLLNLHQFRNHYSWCMDFGCTKGRWGGLEFTKSRKLASLAMTRLHHKIFPELGVRVRIEDVDTFPDNAIFADAYDMARHTSEINKIYSELEDKLTSEDNDENPLTLQLRARQKTELFKVPLLTEMTEELLEEKKSVVIFVNFKETLAQMREALAGKRVGYIYGGQHREERDKAIADFQANKLDIIVCMIQAGGVGISLHDLEGGHPRVSLVCPTFNAVQLKQALGRIHRSGGKTKCVQRVIFAAGTIEERACESVKKKLDNLSLLNDGDLTGGLVYEDVEVENT